MELFGFILLCSSGHKKSTGAHFVTSSHFHLSSIRLVSASLGLLTFWFVMSFGGCAWLCSPNKVLSFSLSPLAKPTLSVVGWTWNYKYVFGNNIQNWYHITISIFMFMHLSIDCLFVKHTSALHRMLCVVFNFSFRTSCVEKKFR